MGNRTMYSLLQRIHGPNISNLEAELRIQLLVQLTIHEGKVIYSYLKGLQ